MIVDVFNTCQTALNKNHLGGLITGSRFNYFAKLAQLKIFDELATDWRNAKTRQLKHKPEMELSKIEQALSVFIKSEPLVKASDKFPLPSDLSYLDVILIDGVTEADEVSTGELAAIKRSKSISASRKNIFFANSGGSITIYPDTIGSVGDDTFAEVTASYYRNPVDPVISTIENDSVEIVNPSASVDFELPEFVFDKLVCYILEPMGLKIREQMVVQYANSEEVVSNQKENA